MDARDGSAGPRWSTIALGLVAVAAGAALTLKPFSSLTALTVYIAVSLAAVGAGELLASRRSPNPWPDRVAGGVLIVAGVAALALPDLTVRGVAVLVGAALVAGGAARLVATFRGAAEASGYGGRYAAATNGLARMIFGGLALTWPDVTVLVLALLVGPVAVLWGLE